MDQINKLQKEVEDLRKMLQLKQEELSRMKNEVNKQNINEIHNTEQTTSLAQLSTQGQNPTVFWTPNTNAIKNLSDGTVKESLDNSVYTCNTSEQYQCDPSIDDHNASFNGNQEQAIKGTKKTETRVSAFIGETLPRWAIERYSRQILLSDIGVSGQQKLCAARVLIVGAGGLGCPAGAYLAGAGVGEIGIVDYDTVDLTNIHRQFLHGEKDQFISKAESAANSLRSLNSRIVVTAHNVQLTSQNGVEIASQYDLVLDCTDNVPTRYLLNDLCVLTKLPLISGSALKMEGQLTVYGYRDKDDKEKDRYIGPCYRCVFPTPPPAAAVGSCSSQGVAPPVPGTIGSLQALEAIKYIVGQPYTKLLVGRMLLFDGDDMTFRTVNLRPRSPNCAVCSDAPTISQLIDYELFCQAEAKEKDLDLRILRAEQRISPTELASLLKDCEHRHLLVDVRSEAEFNMCRIDGSTNYPIETLYGESLDRLLKQIRKASDTVTFVCRRGNDSQSAAKIVLEVIEQEHHAKLKDLCGGLHAWSHTVDKQFPIY